MLENKIEKTGETVTVNKNGAQELETPSEMIKRKVTETYHGAGGLQGTFKTFGNMSWMAFGMVLIWTVLGWYHDSVEKREAFSQTSDEKMWQSLNTTNHNSAGISNSISELIGAVRTLREEVTFLKVQLNRPENKAKVGPTEIGAPPEP